MNLKPHGPLTSSPVIKRWEGNPVLTAEDVSYPATLIFNAGVAKYQGKYVMVFRNDYFPDGRTPVIGNTTLGIAYSDDGITWKAEPGPIFQIDWPYDDVIRAYDPRLIPLEGRIAMCFALDTAHGVRGGIALTDDFAHWEIMSVSAPDNRNMVLCPEKIGGKYVRLERPFPVYSRGWQERFDIWISDSPDLRYWGHSELLLGVEDVAYADAKLGPAAPPVKTPKGWLTTFHAVDKDETRGKNGWEDVWQKRYTAGIMLLDLENPYHIVGLYEEPLMAPETPYEADEGFRQNTIFPGGMILEDDGEVKLYYGAADTVECLATASLDDLLALFD